MYNFFICEDNINTANIIKKYITEYTAKKNMDCHIRIINKNFRQVIEYAKSNIGHVNVYFLDIILNDENTTGLTLAREIRKIDAMAYLIFITSHPELSLKVFQYKLKALDYIYKHDENIQKRVCECIDSITEEINQIGNLDLNRNDRQIILKSLNDVYTVDLNNILYFETNPGSRMLNCVLKDGTTIEFYDTLKNVMRKLDSRFCHCHRSYIINIRYIKKLGGMKPIYTATMSNGKVCDVSKTKWKDLVARVRA
ncbi:MAG: response regulator transcription factor [Clostridiaceae bacterium]|jgi:two-component system response regulator AgrA|nr:response regulator transcription factor [Clostridiaceae bacterium]